MEVNRQTQSKVYLHNDVHIYMEVNKQTQSKVLY